MTTDAGGHDETWPAPRPGPDVLVRVHRDESNIFETATDAYVTPP